MFKSGRVIVALDGLGLQKALDLASSLKSRVTFKIHDLWDTVGPTAVSELRHAGASDILVDLKLHDIPNTVNLRALAVKASGATAVTVHASGGQEMMQAAAALQDENFSVIGVTLLTSLDPDIAHLIYGDPPKATVIKLALWAKDAGVRGLVCSPQEVGIVKKHFSIFKCMVPGIRSAGQDAADQKRIDTPGNTIKAGADYLVVGREITKAKDPIAALENIEKQVQEALFERGMANAFKAPGLS